MRFLLSSIVLGTIGLVAGIRKELLGVEEQKGGPISTCCVVDGYNHLMLDQDFMEEVCFDGTRGGGKWRLVFWALFVGLFASAEAEFQLQLPALPGERKALQRLQ
ncbi:unnamed protein product [Durusdinium trenchii]|uniref:Uncharacterized protein n=1 Tax=Durusdinium trenchii TaxID=1381693 RepID=A0ABP0R2B9_9DINO